MVYDPTYKVTFEFATLSGTVTSTSLNYALWADSDGYVKFTIKSENANGTDSAFPKTYDSKNKKWIN